MRGKKGRELAVLLDSITIKRNKKADKQRKELERQHLEEQRQLKHELNRQKKLESQQRFHQRFHKVRESLETEHNEVVSKGVDELLEVREVFRQLELQEMQAIDRLQQTQSS